MKRMFALFLALVLSVSVSVPAFAASMSNSDENGIISFEEYNAAVTSAYAKVHIGYKCVSHNEKFVFTKKLLNQKLNEIKESTKNYDYDDSLHAFLGNTSIAKIVDGKGTASPNSVFNNLNYYYDVAISNPVGAAGIQITINYTEELQSSTFVSINSCTSRQYGGAIDFRSWNQTGYNLRMNSNRTEISGTVSGTLTTGYTDPQTGMDVIYTADHTIGIDFGPDS